MPTSLGGFYNMIFASNRNAYEYILSWHILNYCISRRMEYNHELKEAQGNEFKGISDDDKQKILEKEYILHSETVFAGLISDIIISKIRSKFYKNLVQLFESGDLVPFNQLYGLVEKIVTSLIRQKSADDQNFQFAKYFKQEVSWTEIKTC